MAQLQFIPTADLVDIIGADVRSCDTQFTQYGAHLTFCGKITTIHCLEDNGLVKQVLAEDNSGGVLVIDGQASMHTALMGDMIAQNAVDHGWAGVIINGPIRDSAVIADMPLGVKALGTNPRKSAKDGVGQKDAYVHLGGIVFQPGEYVYSDQDGIVVTSEPIQGK